MGGDLNPNRLQVYLKLYNGGGGGGGGPSGGGGGGGGGGMTP